MKVLITGGNGYIAKGIKNALWDKHHIIAPNKNELDLTDLKSVNEFFRDKQFDVVIHTAIKGANDPHNDDPSISFWNQVMFWNLLARREKFTKLINLGSGAEVSSPQSPYGYSKRAINGLIHQYENFYTLRIFGVFDENESDTRFIKSNIKRYINQEPVIIHQDKLMDFIYMKDLVSLINFYILNEDLPKEINCVYDQTQSLGAIAHHIVDLSDYTVPINIETKELGPSYIGDHNILSLDYIGLEQGIKNVYDKLK